MIVTTHPKQIELTDIFAKALVHFRPCAAGFWSEACFSFVASGDDELPSSLERRKAEAIGDKEAIATCSAMGAMK